MNRTQSE